MALAKVLDELDFRTQVIDWIDAEIAKNGGDLNEAIKTALVKVKAHRLARGPLWDEIGHDALAYIWRTKVRHGRTEALTPGRRVVDPAALATPEGIMAQLVKVNGVWMTIGKLTKDTAALVADDYRTRAGHLMRRADFFQEIANSLKPRETVAKHFTDASLKALLNKIGTSI